MSGTKRTETTHSSPVAQPPRLESVLVVVDDEVLGSDSPLKSPLLRRAVMLGRHGLRIELFHACRDESLEQKFFAGDAAVQRRKQELANERATRLAELAQWLEMEEGVHAEFASVWHASETEALLERIHLRAPDLVLKRSDQHAFVLGLLPNIDWELIRRSPAHVWFVTGDWLEPGATTRMLTAIGSPVDEENVISAVDYAICGFAGLLADKLAAENTILHTYQIPEGVTDYTMYAPEFGEMRPLVDRGEAHRTLARRHGNALDAFVEFFKLDPERVRLVRGRLSEVLPETARATRAALIVMGARDLSRLERLLKPVDAEKVLASAPCDVVFVRQALDVDEPDEVGAEALGVAEADLPRAVMDPAAAFRTPAVLVDCRSISRRMRQRLLTLWEADVRAEMREENEGGPVGSTRADVLEEIRQARQRLG